MTAPNDINSWWGRDVADRHGDKIGTVDEVYLDPTTGEPKWVAVKTGLLGTHSSLAPLSGAQVTVTHITVGFDKDAVKNVPDVLTGDELTPQDEDRLYHYYRLDRPTPSPTPTASPTPTPSRTGAPAPLDGAEQRDRNRDKGGDRAGETAGDTAGRPRGGSLGAAFSDAARSIGHAASHELREARENLNQRRARDRDATTTQQPGPRTAPRTDHDTTGRETGPQARPNATGAEAGVEASEIVRVRRHVVTEHLSATGEVLKRDTHTEEDNPDQR